MWTEIFSKAYATILGVLSFLMLYCQVPLLLEASRELILTNKAVRSAKNENRILSDSLYSTRKKKLSDFAWTLFFVAYLLFFLIISLIVLLRK